MLYRYQYFTSENLSQIVICGKCRCADPYISPDVLEVGLWRTPASAWCSQTQERISRWVIARSEGRGTALTLATRQMRMQQLRSNPELLGSLCAMVVKAAVLVCGIRYRILSLSALADSAALWARYANGGKGVCLGFSTANTLFGGAEAVKYTDAGILDDLPVGASELELRLLLTKSAKWREECEYRVVTSADGLRVPEMAPTVCNMVSLPPGSLRRVTLGSHMSDGQKRVVKDIVGRSPTPVEICESTVALEDWGEVLAHDHPEAGHVERQLRVEEVPSETRPNHRR
jgi:hypothetical protein